MMDFPSDRAEKMKFEMKVHSWEHELRIALLDLWDYLWENN